LDLNPRKGLSDLNGWGIGVCSISGLPYPMKQTRDTFIGYKYPNHLKMILECQPI